MRLTIRNSDGTVSQPTNLDWSAALEKLAAYEDTGLEPDEIKSLEGEWNAMRNVVDSYRAAEDQGRLVILPCKVGDTVYRIVNRRVDTSGYRMEWDWDTAIEAAKFHVGMINAVGITVFLSREEAEATLKGKTKDV